MSFILESVSFFIDREGMQIIQNQRNIDDSSYEWKLAVLRFFKGTLFVYDNEILLNGKNHFATLIFNPTKDTTYIISKKKIQYFIDKYYPNKRIVKREPSFYSFLIPFPNIEYMEQGKINWEEIHNRRYNIEVSKFYNKTYLPIQEYIVRLKTPNNFDFRKNLFDPIFQKNFQDIVDLSLEYKNYLSIFLNIESDQINTKNLIIPYYQLCADEINALISIVNDVKNELDEEMLKEGEKELDEAYGEWAASLSDDLEWEYFENIRENWDFD